jgi:hypothetical protein
MSKIVQVLLVAFAILLSMSAAVAVQAAPKDPSRLALVFPPWWSSARAAAAAASAGEIVDLGGVPFIVVVHSKSAATIGQARAAGALFVVAGDPRSFCSSLSPGSSS